MTNSSLSWICSALVLVLAAPACSDSNSAAKDPGAPVDARNAKDGPESRPATGLLAPASGLKGSGAPGQPEMRGGDGHDDAPSTAVVNPGATPAAGASAAGATPAAAAPAAGTPGTPATGAPATGAPAAGAPAAGAPPPAAAPTNGAPPPTTPGAAPDPASGSQTTKPADARPAPPASGA